MVIVFGCLGLGAMPEKYAIGIIILGGIILLISLFGCFGAICESSRMLWTVCICTYEYLRIHQIVSRTNL